VRSLRVAHERKASTRVHNGRFTEKVAFITGAARGQGRAEALRLAQEGADIIAVDIRRKLDSTIYPGATQADLKEAVRLVEALGRRIVATAVDVRDFDSLSEALCAGVAELGRLDVVIANAGISSANMSWEVRPEQWQETIDINLTGAFFTAKAAIPILIDQGTGGCIVMTSSTAGLKGLPFCGHYVASKHGLVGLAKTMASWAWAPERSAADRVMTDVPLGRSAAPRLGSILVYALFTVRNLGENVLSGGE